MERLVYAVIEHTYHTRDGYADDFGSGGYLVNKVFVNEEKAEKLCERLNYERCLLIVEKRGIKGVLSQFDYYYSEEIVFDLVNQLEKTDIDFENFTFDEFLKVQDVLISIAKKENWGNKIVFYEVKELIQQF